MESLFGSADHFITHYGFPSEKTNTWNTEVFFGGRYELTMQVEVVVDYSAHSILRLGNPIFYLLEVDRVTLEKVEGVAEPSVGAKFGVQTKFSATEWKKVYESGGDFSSIGIKLNPEPVKNFDELTQATRRPRVPISLIKD